MTTDELMKLAQNMVTEVMIGVAEQRGVDRVVVNVSGKAKAALQTALDAMQAEIAGLKQLAILNSEIAEEMERQRDAYQQAADKMAAEHKAERDALQAKLTELQKQEPVAWMHEERVDVIHKDVKAVLDRCDTDYLHRPIHKSMRYTIPLYASPKALEPDMFWNSDDAEKPHDSIECFLNDQICQHGLEVGAEFTIWQAKKLPNVKIKVTAIDEDESEADWEVIADNGIGGQQ